MSVLPFSPGMTPGMTPGGAGSGSSGASGSPPGGASGAVADPGTTTGGTAAESSDFPDPGAEFAAALTAALGGAAPIASPSPTSTPTPTPAAAPVPDEPAGLAGRTGTVGAPNRHAWSAEPSVGGVGTAVADGKPAVAVPLSSGGTAQPVSVAASADGATLLRDAATSSPQPAPGASRPHGGSSTPVGATGAATTDAGPPTARSAGSDDQLRPFDPPTVPVRPANPDGSSGTGTTPVAGGGVVAAGATAGGGGMPASVSRAEQHPVVQQVLPAVVQLATKGNGTHRISVTLQPEHLGEVRVTMVVRDGEVRVSLATDSRSAAKDVLLQGAPELRRLLEATGATDARVVVRDLPSASTSASTSTPTSTSPSGSTTTSTDRGPGEQAPDNPDRSHTGDQRREGRDVVPTPTIQRAAATSSTAQPATPTTGRLDRTV